MQEFHTICDYNLCSRGFYSNNTLALAFFGYLQFHSKVLRRLNHVTTSNNGNGYGDNPILNPKSFRDQRSVIIVRIPYIMVGEIKILNSLDKCNKPFQFIHILLAVPSLICTLTVKSNLWSFMASKVIVTELGLPRTVHTW